ncbi:MAG: ABC transporter ATP-binding protein [Bergeyella sp.]
MFLELKNTTIGYQSPLISEINTSLELGEICLLIGNNGVGKTTLIKSILNQIPVLNGEIILNGKNIRKLSVKEIAGQISIVFSKSQIPQNYTTTDLISLGKYIHYPYYFELSEQDKNEIDNIIEELGLQQYKDVQLSQLSDGNLQKTFIGRAIAQNSPFIILDEPTTHLDEENKITILQLLRKLAKEQNKLILFSSHDWRLAKEFSDKIWYIKNEKLYSGITEDVLLQHPELVQPKLFHLDGNFVPPTISAPDFQAEMLYSFLQKNHRKNLSSFEFQFTDRKWNIKNDDKNHIFQNFHEISQFLKNHD